MQKKTLFHSRPFTLVALFLIPLAVYSITLANGFVGDDIYIVLNNQWITSVYYIPDIFKSSVWSFVSGSPVSNYYRPMMHLIYMAVYPVVGTEAWGYHLVNIVLHSANTILVFYLADALFSRGEKDGGEDGQSHGLLFPFLAAMLFALHPLNTEVVSWIAAIPELSFTFFFLLSLNMYLRVYAGGRGFSKGYYALSVAFFLPALFCKETAIVLPAFLIAYDFSNRGFALLKKALVYLPFILLAVFYLAIRTIALGSIVHHKDIDLSYYLYILNILPIIPRYILKFIMPFPLKASYVFHQKDFFYDPAVVASSFFTVAYAGAVFFFRKNRIVFSTLLWIVIALLPTLYLPVIPGGFAERYFYLPSAAASVLAVYMLKNLLARSSSNPKKRFAVAMALVAALLAFYAVADAKRAMAWKDNVTLWSDSVKKTPDNSVAHANLAWAFQKQGELEGAVREYKEVIRLGKEKTTGALINLGGIYMDTGNYAGAITALGDALRRTPGNAALHFNIATAYNSTGDRANAIRHLTEAIRLNPGNDSAYFNLAWTYSESGNNAAAIFFYNEAIKLAPEKADAYYNLGIIYELEGDLDNAVKALYRAYGLDPGNKDIKARLERAILKRRSVE